MAEMSEERLSSIGEVIASQVPLRRQDAKDLYAEVRRLQERLSEAERLNRQAVCVYCCQVEDLDSRDQMRETMLRHIKECEKHPLRTLADTLTNLEFERDRELQRAEKMTDLLLQARGVISTLQTDMPAGGILDRIDAAMKENP